MMALKRWTIIFIYGAKRPNCTIYDIIWLLKKENMPLINSTRSIYNTCS